MGVMTAREFYQNKANVLARVEAGETISLTKHGRAIADIVPRRDRRPSLAAISENTPLQRGTPEWQVAHDRMVRMMDEGFSWGGRVTYEDKHE